MRLLFFSEDFSPIQLLFFLLMEEAKIPEQAWEISLWAFFRRRQQNLRNGQQTGLRKAHSGPLHLHSDVGSVRQLGLCSDVKWKKWARSEIPSNKKMLTVSGVRLTSVKFWGKVDSLEFPSLEGEARFLGALEVMPHITTLQRERERERGSLFVT